MSDLKATLTYNGKSEYITGTKFKFNYATYPSTSWYEEAATRTESCNGLYMKGNYSIENENGTSITLSCADHIMKTNISTTIEVVTPTTYIITIPALTIATLVVKGNYGGSERTLSNGDTIYAGETVTWTATCPNGYHFDNKNDKLSDNGSETISGNYTVPRSDATWSTYSITSVLEHIDYSETPSSTIHYGESDEFMLDSPESGYELKNGPTATNATITEDTESGKYYINPTGTGDIVITCIATAIEKIYVHFSGTEHANITARGTESSCLEDGDELVKGENIIWSATPHSRYRITSMTPESPVTNVQTDITLTVVTEEASVTVTAYGYPNYVIKNGNREDYTVSINPSSGWCVGDSVTLTPTTPTVHSDCMRFGKWEREVDGVPDYTYSYNNPLTDTIPSCSTLSYGACYELYISVTSEDTSKGTVNTPGEWMYPNYSQMRVIATPATGYTFVGWYDEDNNLWSTDADYTVETSHTVWPHDIEARFDAIPYTVTYNNTEQYTWNKISETVSYGGSTTAIVSGDIEYLYNITDENNNCTILYDTEGQTSQMNVSITNVKGNCSITAYKNT